MNLTRYTDYGLRVLTYLALLPEEKLTNVDELSEIYGISRNNLNKIVHQLSKESIVQTKKGKGGGLKLALLPEQINLGDMLLLMESSMQLVDCTKPECSILPACRLKGILAEATNAFISVLKKYTLADLVAENNHELRVILDLS